MPSPVHPYSDYGVALRTLRSARSWLGFLLFACVVCQFAGFALMYWTQQPYKGLKPERAFPRSMSEARAVLHGTTLPVGPTSAPAGGQVTVAAPEEVFYPGTVQSRGLNVRNQWDTTYTMVAPITQLAALIAVSSQAIIIFITLLVVLIAQAPGVAQMTRGLIWSVLLTFMFFPWQYFARDFPIPGVLYSYTELLKFITPHIVAVVGEHVYPYQTFLLYARFIGWPLLGLFVLLMTAERYRAGIMIAIGHPLQSILQARTTGPAPTLRMPGPEKK